MLAKKMTNALLFSALAISGGVALASESSPATLNQVSIDDLRNRCQEILNNPQMVRPEVEVSCSGQLAKWEACSPSSFALQDTTVINGSIGMKNMEARGQTSLDVAKPQSCGYFYQHTVDLRAPTTKINCEDLLANSKTQDDLTSRCADVIKYAQTQGTLESKDNGATGELRNTCSGASLTVQQGDMNPCASLVSQASQSQQGQAGAQTGAQAGAQQTGAQAGAQQTGAQAGAQQTGAQAGAQQTGAQAGAQTGAQAGGQSRGF